MSEAPPHGYGLSEDQLSGAACAGPCERADVPLFAAGTVEIRGGEPPVQIVPIRKCDACLPPERRLIVIASSDEAAR